MDEPSPQQQLMRMISGYWLTQAIYVAAKLGIADLVASGPQTAEALAKQTDTQPRALYRLLRALASVGVFAEGSDGGFALTPMADLLRRDVPGSQQAMAIMTGEEHYVAYSELLWSVRTGKPGFDKVYGAPVFDFLAKHPEQARVFDRAMVSVHGRETGAMLDAYDFSGIGVLADVGGGNGSVLPAVLRKHPAMRGMLYDLPNVVERARDSLRDAGLADRCQVVAGSFFESVPAGADAYQMRHIIHDWDHDRCVRILRNIHQVADAKTRLLIVEGIVPPSNAPAFGKLLDLTMLVIPGGEERTRDEYDALFRAGGWRLERVVPTTAEVSVLEGRKA
jgi:hypothetical protein